MRNYDEEIKQLTIDINQLNLEKKEKEIQLRLVLKERKENKKKTNSPILRDQAGVIIKIGDRVKATSTGKFRRSEGTVVKFNKWVTFEDQTGVKHVRAPNNILIDKDGRERTYHTSSTGRRGKSEPTTKG